MISHDATGAAEEALEVEDPGEEAEGDDKMILNQGGRRSRVTPMR